MAPVYSARQIDMAARGYRGCGNVSFTRHRTEGQIQDETHLLSSRTNKNINERIYDIFINCNWVVTRWQYTFTHKQYT